MLRTSFYTEVCYIKVPLCTCKIQCILFNNKLIVITKGKSSFTAPSFNLKISFIKLSFILKRWVTSLKFAKQIKSANFLSFKIHLQPRILLVGVHILTASYFNNKFLFSFSTGKKMIMLMKLSLQLSQVTLLSYSCTMLKNNSQKILLMINPTHWTRKQCLLAGMTKYNGIQMFQGIPCQTC